MTIDTTKISQTILKSKTRQTIEELRDKIDYITRYAGIGKSKLLDEYYQKIKENLIDGHFVGY
jgi:hypothetical protein